MDFALTLQLSASEASIASSTAWRFRTGSAPGMPKQIGHTLLLGGAPKLVGHAQKILVLVASWTWTSSPMTGSYLSRRAAETSVFSADGMFHYKGRDALLDPRGPLGLLRVVRGAHAE